MEHFSPGTKDDFEDEEREAYTATELDLDLYQAEARNTDAGDRRSFLRQKFDDLIANFLPSHVQRKKADLSLFNALEWEENVGKFEPSTKPTFRSSTPLRSILLDYLRHVEPLLDDSSVALSSPDASPQLISALQSTFTEDKLTTLAQIGHDVADVASWSWIFSSQNIDLAACRYAALAQDLRDSGRGRIPKFVLLQLLRAANVSAFALRKLLQTTLTELQTCKDAKQYIGWSWITRVCLVVRLLRHARRVDPDCFDDITSIVGHLFAEYYVVQEGPLRQPERQRLSHIFNRFLSLLALPTLKAPFNAYLLQQNAQLALVRLMVAFKPQLPLTREGHRALIAVQLLHRKSGHERTWAEAKSPSWPPWRRIRSGIEQDLEYPGKSSRVMKLLRRMNEAGYTHGTWEKSAAVLAGWDTDRSPTVQTRAILMRQRQPWNLAPGKSVVPDGRSNEDAELWATRVRATRSRREAWASFCAYEKSTESSRKQYQPYFAMFEKLLVRTVTADAALESGFVPGDVKEVFEDSPNPRDLIYVEKDVPSVDEFYDNMLRAGIYPGGSLLGELLNHAPNIEAGLTYIQDSRWDEVTKDVLRHAEKYPPATIRHTFNRLPVPCLAAYIWLLARHGNDAQPAFYWNNSFFDKATGQSRSSKRMISPLMYSWRLLSVAGTTDVRAWNAFLKGALECIRDVKALSKESSFVFGDDRAIKNELWRRLWRQFHPESQALDIHPDLEFFRHLTGIISILIKDVNNRRLRLPAERLGSLAKSTFLRAVHGQDITTFLTSPATPILVVPGASELRLLIRVLVSIGDIDGLVALLKWLNTHSSTFARMNNHCRSDTETIPPSDRDHDLPPLRPALCAIRLFLAGSPAPTSEADDNIWFQTPFSVDPARVEEARTQCEALGWPTDEEVQLFVAREGDWMERLARTAERGLLRYSKTSSHVLPHQQQQQQQDNPSENTE